ncbi:hypothetical protein WJX77_003467 [Trebouxia sp. C0004]
MSYHTRSSVRGASNSWTSTVCLFRRRRSPVIPKRPTLSPERAAVPAKVTAVFERQTLHDHVLDAISHIEAQAACKGQRNVTPAPQQHLAGCGHTVAAPGLAPFEDTCMAAAYHKTD